MFATHLPDTEEREAAEGWTERGVWPRDQKPEEPACFPLGLR